MTTLQNKTQKLSSDLVGKYIIKFTKVCKITEVSTRGEAIIIRAFSVKDNIQFQDIELDITKNIYHDYLCNYLYYDGTTESIKY